MGFFRKKSTRELKRELATAEQGKREREKVIKKKQERKRLKQKIFQAKHGKKVQYVKSGMKGIGVVAQRTGDVLGAMDQSISQGNRKQVRSNSRRNVRSIKKKSKRNAFDLLNQFD